MRYENVTKNGVGFIKFYLDRIDQKGRCFFVTKISAKLLIEMHTVEPAEYELGKISYLAEDVSDDKEYYEAVLKHKEEVVRAGYFQRNVDQGKLNEVCKYLNEKEYAFFPNSIIVTADTSSPRWFGDGFDEYVEFIKNNDKEVFSFFEAPLNGGEGEYCLYVPKRAKSILVIDGQHRIKGLAKSEKALAFPYELLLSFIVNYDKAVIAEQFYTINSTPKRVSRSVLLHLMGEFGTGASEKVFLHEVARVLNEFDRSPLFRRMKMMGKVDRSISQNQQRLQNISQAFFFDYLERAVELVKSKSVSQPIFVYYYVSGKDGRMEIQRFLFKYFMAVSRLRADDWDDSSSVLTKTVGIGAIISLMFLYFVQRFVDVEKMDTKWINKLSASDIQNDLKGMETFDFKQFSGQSSASTLSEIKESLVAHIDFFQGDSYGEYMLWYKKECLTPYLKWYDEKVWPMVEEYQQKMRLAVCE